MTQDTRTQDTMTETKIHTLEVRGSHLVISASDAAQYKEEAVKIWTIRHQAFTIADLIAVGRQMADSGLLTTAERVVVDAARGSFVAERVGCDPKPADLPTAIVAELGRVLYFGGAILQADIDALKKPS